MSARPPADALSRRQPPADWGTPSRPVGGPGPGPLRHGAASPSRRRTSSPLLPRRTSARGRGGRKGLHSRHRATPLPCRVNAAFIMYFGRSPSRASRKASAASPSQCALSPRSRSICWWELSSAAAADFTFRSSVATSSDTPGAGFQPRFGYGFAVIGPSPRYPTWTLRPSA